MGRAAALGLALTMFLAGRAFAADQPIELKLSTWLPPAHPLNPSLQAWATDVEKASGGTIKSTLFTSEQLGKAFDHYDMARDGIADFTYVNPGYQPGRFPVAAAAELPFLMANAKGGSAAFDAWYRKYAAQEMKDVHYCMGFVLDPGTFHARKKIMRPEDISGVKVRPAGATMAAFVTLLGGANVQASAPEARDALERGVADAITFPWGSLVLFGIDKVVKYHMDAALYVSDFVWVMNKTKYETLSSAQRDVIDAHCNTEWAEKIASPWADFEAAGREKVRNEPGHEVYKISPDDLAAWRKAAEPLTAKWADGVRKAGVDPDKAMAELRATLEQHQAMY